MEKSDKRKLTHEQEVQRYVDELARYYKQSSNSNVNSRVVKPPVVAPRVAQPVVTAMATSQTPEEQYLEYKKANPKTGYLKVQAFTARRTYPVPDVTIEVSKKFPAGRYVIGQLTTGAGGVSDVIAIPTPDKELSEIPGNTHLFTSVDVKVKHKDFVEMNFFNVPIFEDITSIQTADLLPLAAASEGMSSIDVVEREPSDL
ncbi:MAG: hypothetical protein RR444_08455 [Oscillospiraceae bacterium]